MNEKLINERFKKQWLDEIIDLHEQIEAKSEYNENLFFKSYFNVAGIHLTKGIMDLAEECDKKCNIELIDDRIKISFNYRGKEIYEMLKREDFQNV